MSTPEPTIGSRPGLATVVDTVVAPNAAFARLRAVPTWGWAFLIVTVLGIIGTFMVGPAIAHALDTSLPAKLAANPQIAKLPPAEQQRMIATQMQMTHVMGRIFPIFVPITALIVALLQGLVMTGANAIGGGDGSFKKYFALSMNVTVVGYGLASVVLGVIVLVHGAASYEDQTAVTNGLPNLGMLAPGLKGFGAGFLGAISIFYVWGTVLLALGMQGVGRVKPAVAWIAAILMLLCTAAFAGFGAQMNG